MRTPLTTLLAFIFAGAVGRVALADDPTPAPPPPPPDVPEEKKLPIDEPKPEENKPEEKKPEPPKGVNIPSTSTTSGSSSGSSGSTPVFDNMGSSGTPAPSVQDEYGGKKPVHLAVELTGAGGKLGDPYIVYQGWTLQNGASKGTRLEAQLAGVMLAYELTSMSNTKACADACVTGDFGSTTFHELEVGYRYRLGMIGPIRPYITASLGGVLANSGDWGATSGKSKGAVGRAAAGVEIPFAKKFFASGNINYRLIVTENPYRDPQQATAGKALVDMADEPSGNFAQDAHVISVNLGVGVSL